MTATNVADRLWDEQKIRVDRRKLEMETIKRVGRYTVPVELFTDVTAELELVVAPEGVEPPSEEEQAGAEADAAAAAQAEAESEAPETPEAEESYEEPEAEALTPAGEAPADELA